MVNFRNQEILPVEAIFIEPVMGQRNDPTVERRGPHIEDIQDKCQDVIIRHDPRMEADVPSLQALEDITVKLIALYGAITVLVASDSNQLVLNQVRVAMKMSIMISQMNSTNLIRDGIANIVQVFQGCLQYSKSLGHTCYFKHAWNNESQKPDSTWALYPVGYYIDAIKQAKVLLDARCMNLLDAAPRWASNVALAAARTQGKGAYLARLRATHNILDTPTEHPDRPNTITYDINRMEMVYRNSSVQAQRNLPKLAQDQEEYDVDEWDDNVRRFSEVRSQRSDIEDDNRSQSTQLSRASTSRTHQQREEDDIRSEHSYRQERRSQYQSGRRSREEDEESTTSSRHSGRTRTNR